MAFFLRGKYTWNTLRNFAYLTHSCCGSNAMVAALRTARAVELSSKNRDFAA